MPALLPDKVIIGECYELHTITSVINSDNRRSDGMSLVDIYSFGSISCPVFHFL